MSRLLNLPKSLRRLLGKTADDSVALAAERFFLAFRDHGVSVAQIPRLLPQIKLDDLQSPERLLAILTPELLDQVATLFGIRSEWLEGHDDRIYEYLATYKEPQHLLDHFRSLWHRRAWKDGVSSPLRILATTKHLDYRNDQRHELAPILVEQIGTIGDEPIYRYHIYQDGFSWDHQPARIELKAIARTIFQALGKAIPLYPISSEDMEDLLDGKRIPRDLLRHALITNPSFEDYVVSSSESGVAKETDELPAVFDYMARMGLDAYDFSPIVDGESTLVAQEPTVSPSPKPVPPLPSVPEKPGKRQALRETWLKIEAAAIALWAQDKTLSITEVVGRVRMIPEIKAIALKPDTIHKRIAKLAPPEVRGKSGRKPRKSG